MSNAYGLVLHGGAGDIRPGHVSAQIARRYHTALSASLDAGYEVLQRGGSALDAVVAAVQVLEDSPLFNAGHGAVFNADGFCELDASLMDGRTRAAGAVAGLQHIRNPIVLARDVLQRSEHVMLAGRGAERFAETVGHTLVPNAYFQTLRRQEQLMRAQAREAQLAQPASAPGRFVSVDENDDLAWLEQKLGTVGCAALDRDGHLAAGTSTGGLVNKRFGRVGDSPIIGAGTYADDATCALSATGQGEYFMRAVVGHDVAAQMRYGGRSLAAAAEAALNQVRQLGGTGGLVAIDRQGNIALPFTTPGMYRGYKLSDGRGVTALFADTP